MSSADMHVAASYPLNLIALSSHTPGSLRCHLDFGGILSPSLSVPSLLPSVPLTSTPLIAAMGSGGAHKLSSGSGAEPGRQAYFRAF